MTKELLIIYKDAINSVLDLLAFSFATPEFVSKETWTKVGDLGRDAFMYIDRMFHKFIEEGYLPILAVVYFIIVVPMLFIGIFVSLFLPEGKDYWVYSNELLAKGYVWPAWFVGAFGTFTVWAVVIVFGGGAIFYFLFALRQASRMAHSILARVRLGPILLIVGIVLFFTARVFTIYVSFAEADAHIAKTAHLSTSYTKSLKG